MKRKFTFLFMCCFLFNCILFAQQVITIGTGTAISAISPHNHATSYTVTEILYYQSEISVSGFITAIAFEKHDGTNLDSIQNVKIFLTHTTATSYTAGVFDTTGAGYVEVYSGSFPNNALSGWMEVQLQTPFSYDNINNLQVMLLKDNSPTVSAAGERARYRYFAAPVDRIRRYNSNTPYVVGSTSLTTTNFTSNIRLTMAPPAPPDCPILVSPINNSTNICPHNPVFVWTQFGGIPANNFELYLGTDGGGIALPTNVINGTLTGNVGSFQYNGNLTGNTTYYWTVLGVNAAGSSINCVIDSFTTGSEIISNVSSTPDSTGMPNCTGTVSASPTGGSPPYSISWTSGSTTNLCQGWYTVMITDFNGCTKTDSVFVTSTTGIDEVSNSLFEIFPNPASDFITIISSSSQIEKIKIYDVTGKLITEKFIQGNRGEVEIKQLSSGSYFIEVKNYRIKFKKL